MFDQISTELSSCTAVYSVYGDSSKSSLQNELTITEPKQKQMEILEEFDLVTQSESQFPHFFRGDGNGLIHVYYIFIPYFVSLP